MVANKPGEEALYNLYDYTGLSISSSQSTSLTTATSFTASTPSPSLDVGVTTSSFALDGVCIAQTSALARTEYRGFVKADGSTERGSPGRE